MGASCHIQIRGSFDLFPTMTECRSKRSPLRNTSMRCCHIWSPVSEPFLANSAELFIALVR